MKYLLILSLCLGLIGCKKREPDKIWIIEYSFLKTTKTIEVTSKKKPWVETQSFGVGAQQIRYWKTINKIDTLIILPLTYTIIIYEKGHRPNIK